jgi:hypothetical protein
MASTLVKYRPAETKERGLRIRLSVAAYAYEYENDSIMSDAEFDDLCMQVNLEQGTGYRKLDNYFRKEFIPDTGLWIRKHPDKRGLSTIYHRVWKDRKDGN